MLSSRNPSARRTKKPRFREPGFFGGGGGPPGGAPPDHHPARPEAELTLADGDGLGQRVGGLGDPQRQRAVLEAGFDRIRLDVARKLEAARELAVTRFDVAVMTFLTTRDGLLLAAQHEMIVLHLHADVFTGDAGKLRPQLIRLFLFDDVDGRDEARGG